VIVNAVVLIYLLCLLDDQYTLKVGAWLLILQVTFVTTGTVTSIA